MSDLMDILKNKNFYNLKNKKIAFVQPLYPHCLMAEDHGRKSYSSLLPNLGILQIMAYLKKQKINNKMEYFESAAYSSLDQLERTIRQFLGKDTGILAISTYTQTIFETIAFLNRWKDDEVLKIAGGPHVTCMPDTSFTHILIRGEGEETLKEVIKFFPNLSKIKSGIAYVLNGREIITPPRYNSNLDKIPLLDYGAIRKYRQQKLYKPSIERELGEESFIYMSSQGCKGTCSFCPTRFLHGRYRYKSTQKTIQELKHLINHESCRVIEFHDDDFLQRSDADKILLFLKKAKVKWTCFARVDSVNEEIIKNMAQSGCKRLFLGVESGNQENLAYFLKRTTVSQNKKALQVCKKHNLPVEIGIILGTSKDTLESIKQTFDFITSNPIRFCSISILAVNPGTVEWKRSLDSGLLKTYLSPKGILTKQEDSNKLEPLGVPSVCENLNKQQLNWLIDIGYAFFYLRPSQIKLNFSNTDSFSEVYELLNLLKEIYENFVRLTLIKKEDLVIDFAKEVLGKIDPGWKHSLPLVYGPSEYL